MPLVSIFNFGLSDSDQKLEIPFKGTDFSVFSTDQSGRLNKNAPMVSCEVKISPPPYQRWRSRKWT